MKTTKIVIVAAAAVALPALAMSALSMAGVAIAQERAKAAKAKAAKAEPRVPDDQPTGYQIRGCTYYELDGTKVVQICDERSPKNFFKRQEQINPSGGGSQ